MDLIKCTWSVLVELNVKDYPDEGVHIDDLKPLIKEIRSGARTMVIRMDLTGLRPMGVSKIQNILALCSDVVEYTKNDDILSQVQIVGAGTIFRTVYDSLCFVVPIHVRNMIRFV